MSGTNSGKQRAPKRPQPAHPIVSTTVPSISCSDRTLRSQVKPAPMPTQQADPVSAKRTFPGGDSSPVPKKTSKTQKKVRLAPFHRSRWSITIFPSSHLDPLLFNTTLPHIRLSLNDQFNPYLPILISPRTSSPTIKSVISLHNTYPSPLQITYLSPRVNLYLTTLTPTIPLRLIWFRLVPLPLVLNNGHQDGSTHRPPLLLSHRTFPPGR